MKLKTLILALALSLGIFGVAANAQSNTSARDLEKRVQERKARIKEVLSAAQQNRLKNRCKAAQLKITAAQKIAAQHSDNQDKRIDTLLARLTDFAGKQKENGADTTNLEAALATVSKRSEAVKAAYEDYISALSDAAAVDCQSDPAGFKASLVDGRNQFKILKTARQDLRKSLREDLVPALKDFKPRSGA